MLLHQGTIESTFCSWCDVAQERRTNESAPHLVEDMYYVRQYRLFFEVTVDIFLRSL
jgi:hypothetical protein